ncbi:MAG: hypothetical protein ACP5OZ_02985 [Candidatus Woesearchaeota archaeon]
MEEAVDIPESKYFVLKDGKRLASIQELVEALRVISDDVFYHHVNDFKNDFENWVRFVFLNNELADKIGKFKTRNDILLELQNYVLKNKQNKQEINQIKKSDLPKEDKNPKILELETRLESIRKRISELRKQGFDTKNAELMILMVPPRIRFAEITCNEIDFFKAEQSIKNIELELKEIESSKPN